MNYPHTPPSSTRSLPPIRPSSQDFTTSSSTPSDVSPHTEPDGPLSGAWYSTRELACLLRVDPSTLRRWRTAHPRQGPPYVPVSGRVVLYSARDVETWLTERRVTPGVVG
ncbi:helix-turn-helix domain-containing protein [Streptomyces katsurahamanus]|uniref:helix-turn-helix domain-containing protein n=1 Tax=Streptomyces katsurahamanus TaxID=2577098 RepID=UPI002B201E32|nr:helix-turn-helix domain-containing protein [Streptomyces katsurahamanus]